MLGDAPSLSFLQGFSPPCLVCRSLEDAMCASMVLQEPETKLKRVFSCSMCRLVDKAFDSEGVVRTPDRTPKTDRDRCVYPHIFDPDIRHFVFHIAQPLDSRRIYSSLDLLGKNTAKNRRTYY